MFNQSNEDARVTNEIFPLLNGILKDIRSRPLQMTDEITCSFSKIALKPKLAKHKEFAELSKSFVMVNTEDDDEPKGEQFDVDGKYVPRIFFLGEFGREKTAQTD